ncbi:MAG: LAGLIDADG family homing endonuclease [archaeon]
MEIPVIAEQAIYKGLDIVGTADCLHAGWLQHLEANLKEVAPGTYKHGGFETRFILQTEVEGLHRIHHLVFLPDFEAVRQLRKEFSRHGNLDTDGRPKLRLTGEEIAGMVLEAGGMVGPGHAFTPYTAVYSAFNSLSDCYGKHIGDIHFLELGLSADSEIASGIRELDRITFLSNSDGHCLHPDTSILLSNGMPVEIKNLDDPEVCSMAFDTDLKLKKATPIKMIRRPAPPFLYSIKSKSRAIKTTEDHRFFVLDDDRIVEKFAHELKKGDLIACLRNFPFENKPFILPKFALKRYYRIKPAGLVYLSKKRKKIALTQKDVATRLKIHELQYHFIEKGRIKCEKNILKKLCRCYKIRFRDFKKRFISNGYPTFKNTRYATQKLSQIVGYALGDGSREIGKKVRGFSIADKDKKLLELYQKKIYDVFNVRGCLEKRSKQKSYRLRLPSCLLDYITLMAPEIFVYSPDRKIPEFVFDLPRNQVGSFLKGFFDAEGSAEHHGISVCSSSLILLKQMQALLLRFGIVSYVYPYILEKKKKRYRHRLYIYGKDSLDIFKKRIGFDSEKKMQKLLEYTSSVKQTSKDAFVDYLPLKNTIRELMDLLDMRISHFPKRLQYHIYKGRTLRRRHLRDLIEIFQKHSKDENANSLINKLKKFVESDIIWEMVKEVKKIDSDCEYVYDLTIPTYENYIAEGIIVHNSPWPDKLGREFNRLEIKEPIYAEVIKALKNEGGRRVALNVGVPCIYGKYHLTRCTKCLAFYYLEDAIRFGWRCQKCKGIIKKGVKDRIAEMAGGGDRSRHPPYLSITPLSEIIALSKGVSGTHTEKVQGIWRKFIELGTEIEVLIDLPVESLRKVDADVAGIIGRFRQKQLHYIPGGGGEYGKLVLEKPKKLDFYDSKQKTLGSWAKTP